MKHLNQFITEYIIKKKLEKPIDSEDHYEYYPKSKEELIENIKELIKQDNYDFNCIDTSKITDMSDLFYHSKFETINIDVSNWDVSNVENMSNMFSGCIKFNCDLSNWNVSNVEDMEYMFVNCKNLKCDLSKWDVSKVKDMTVMFYNCNSLKNKPSWYKE